MAKFIELDHYDIMENRPAGKRIVNVDVIKELSGPFTAGANTITRVYLTDNDFIDVPDTLVNVQKKIEAI